MVYFTHIPIIQGASITSVPSSSGCNVVPSLMSQIDSQAVVHSVDCCIYTHTSYRKARESPCRVGMAGAGR